METVKEYWVKTFLWQREVEGYVQAMFKTHPSGCVLTAASAAEQFCNIPLRQ